MVKVLITDPISEKGVEKLREIGTVDVIPDLTENDLIEVIGEYDGLIVRSKTKVTSDVIYKGKNLKIIGRAGTGLDNIDLEAAKANRIEVINTPGGNAIAAAELTIGMMLNLARHIPKMNTELKDGKWEKGKYEGAEVYGKTLGIFGLGNVGKEVARRAYCFGMEILGHDIVEKYVKEVKMTDKDELLKCSNYITLHVPLTYEPPEYRTHHLLSTLQFEQMKRDVKIVNCARGGIIDDKALYEAIVSGRVAGAALDVFEVEPPPRDYPLLQLEQVIATPHVGASTREAQARVGEEIAYKVINTLKKYR